MDIIIAVVKRNGKLMVISFCKLILASSKELKIEKNKLQDKKKQHQPGSLGAALQSLITSLLSSLTSSFLLCCPSLRPATLSSSATSTRIFLPFITYSKKSKKLKKPGSYENAINIIQLKRQIDLALEINAYNS